ncbi:MAG: hypothetical protein JSW12_09515 [Deltaproteobacteria bacterium]|nr:MAG: hypothetical protein JSW12_09515 [Deltaproteobacteria bacterium]
MSKEQGSKKKAYKRVVIFGMLSVISYVFIFTNQDAVIDFTTRGGIFSALPIAAAFYFSFIHGTFTSNLLSILGIEPQTKNSETRIR